MHVNLGDAEHIAKKLAKDKYGDNVSLCIQQLLKDEYHRIKNKEQQNIQKTSLLLYQLLFYTILTTTVVTIGLTFLFAILVVILPILLFILGMICIMYMVATYRMKKSLPIKVNT